MSVGRRGRFGILGTAAFALLALGAAVAPPSLAQDRTLATLADVPAVMPAPFHPHVATAVYSASLYDGRPYHGGVRYWH
ncbi:MAG TPA: hypothetical protein VK432_06420 [Stellaceae bacterium]|nr:hypothetical protein [Stellaceae bacterium]